MEATESSEPGTSCPQCGTATVSERAATPWCPACEWNLDAPEPRWWDVAATPRLRRRRERRVRRHHAMAYRMVREQYRSLRGRPLRRSVPARDRALLLAVSVVLLALPAGCLALAAWLFAQWRFLPALVVGGLLVGLAASLRPRFPKLDPGTPVLRRPDAPELFGLVDEVAAAAGARPVRLLTLGHEFNASTWAVGLRRHRTVELGLPLWAALPPQQRVALLGHELGHFVNRDVRYGILTQPAATTLARLAVLLHPFDVGRRAKLSEIAAAALSWVVLWPVSRLLAAGQIRLWRLGFRDGQRAEYLADEVAAEVAGSRAAADLLDRLLLGPEVDLAVRRRARQGEEAAGWRDAADEVVAAASADRIARLRQLSVRWDSNLYESHPPNGLHAGMVLSRPDRQPVVELDQARSDKIDGELAAHYRRCRRVIARPV